MGRLDDEPEWVGGTLSLRRRCVRGLLLLAIFALPALLVPGMAWETRLGWLGAGVLVAAAIVAIPGRGVFSAPPPVYDLIYVAVLLVEIFALVGVAAWASDEPAPGLLDGAHELIGFRFGPVWLSSLPDTLADTHAACLILSVLLVVAGAIRLSTMHFPRAGERDWALSWRAGRAVEVSRTKKQKAFGTGALRNFALASAALYFPLKEGFATEMIVLPGVIPLELGVFLLLVLKCGAVISLAMLGVAIVKIGLSEGEATARAITGRRGHG